MALSRCLDDADVRHQIGFFGLLDHAPSAVAYSIPDRYKRFGLSGHLLNKAVNQAGLPEC